MKFAWLVLAFGLTGTALGQNAPEPPMFRTAMKMPPRYWTTTTGETVSVRFLTMDRSKVQLLLGDGQKTRIATVQIPLLNGESREWISQEVNRRAELNKKSSPRYRAR